MLTISITILLTICAGASEDYMQYSCMVCVCVYGRARPFVYPHYKTIQVLYVGAVHNEYKILHGVR